MSEWNRKMPEPYELLDLPDGGSVDLAVTGWERGSMTITLRNVGAGETKEIQVLRVHLAPGVKEFPPMYYDITSKTLIVQLLPQLLQPNYADFRFRITKHGVAPRARFTLETRLA